MPGGFWKALGSKLLDAGAAYLEQVRVVNELKHLSPEEARPRFMEYVQGLSSTARAGLTVTLATLANSERDVNAKRVIECFRAGLVNPQQTQPLASAPVASPQPAARPSFEEDVNRVAAWRELQSPRREETVGAYLDALDLDGLEHLHSNLALMRTNCAANIKNHRDNEARIAAGRFIEDQMNYRALVLAGGPRDPEWMRQLQDLQGWEHWFGALHEAVGKLIDARHQPPPSPPPPSSPKRSDSLRELDGLRTFLDEQLTTGNVRGERAVASRRLLDKIEAVLRAHNEGEISAEEAQNRFKQLYAAFNQAIADPGPASRVGAGNTRLKRIDAYAGAMKVALGEYMMESPPKATADAIGAILGDLMQFQNEIAKGGDDTLAQLESELLRPAAHALHELMMTRHTLVARPLWESVQYQPAVNRIAYSGSKELYRTLEAAVAPHRLMVSRAQRLKNHGQERWDELNTCHVACFDLLGASEIAELAIKRPQRARELGEAAYELGLAFALGKPVIVAGAGDETMPFDLDLAPVALEGDDADKATLAQAVDEAFYVLQRSSCSSSIPQSIAFLDRFTLDHPKRRIFEGMGWLAPALADDPVGFAAKAEQLIRALPTSPRFRFLRPAWPAAYPDKTDRRCFHVMPFGPRWADEVRDVARAACLEQGITYRRGDEAEEGRIIHAIWDDLCRASIVLVDLTGPNLNVLIELGIAHAIGRPVLAVRQHDAGNILPKHIEKLRVLPYKVPADLKDLLLGKRGLARLMSTP